MRLSPRTPSPTQIARSKLAVSGEGRVASRTALIRAFIGPLGFDATVFALVKLSSVGRANLAGFSESIRGLPEVVERHVLMGAFDFLLKIVTKDIHAYERFFFERLSALEEIQDVTSSVALSEIKAGRALPI